MHNPKDLSVIDVLPGVSRLSKLIELIDKVNEFSSIYASVTSGFAPQSGSEFAANDADTVIGNSNQGRGSSRSTDVMSRIVDVLADIKGSHNIHITTHV